MQSTTLEIEDGKGLEMLLVQVDWMINRIKRLKARKRGTTENMAEVSRKAKWLRRAVLTALGQSPNVDPEAIHQRLRRMADPYAEGFKAGEEGGKAGEGPAENPYDSDDFELAALWDQGFVEGRD